jgi:putative flippase GtrA
MTGKSIWQACKFLLFSISAGVIQIGSFTLFNELCGWEYWLAYLVSLVLSVLWNFTYNRRFTFKSAANVPIAMAKVFGFYLVFTPLSLWLGHLAVESGANEYLTEGVTMVCNFVLEFLFCKFVVYRHQENTLVKNEPSNDG